MKTTTTNTDAGIVIPQWDDATAALAVDFFAELDSKIDRLTKGGRVQIGAATFAERSGDGKTLRFVRETSSGFTVFKTCKF